MTSSIPQNVVALSSIENPFAVILIILEKLVEIEKCLKQIIVLNRGANSKHNPICIQGWIDNITSLKLLWSELKERFDFQFLFTRRLTQDCLENAFAIVRGKGGNNVTPDASKFRSALRTVMINNLLSPSQDSNCEADAAVFLTKYNYLKMSYTMNVRLNSSDNRPICNEENEIIDNIVQTTQANADSYVIGWAISRLPHNECKSVLMSLEHNSHDPENFHILVKKYESSNMIFPNECAHMLCSKMSSIFQNNVNKLICESTHAVKHKLVKSLMSEYVSVEGMCDNCYFLLAHKYFAVLNKALVNKTNDSYTSQQKKKNVKLQKVTHM